MPKLLWLILAESSIIDNQTNNISILKVLEQISLKFPEKTTGEFTIPFNYQILALFQKSTGTDPDLYPLVLELIDPNEKILYSMKGEIQFGGKKRARLIISLNGLKVSGRGEHLYRVSLDKPEGRVLLGETRLDVQSS